jgi:hypothetical protein
MNSSVDFTLLTDSHLSKATSNCCHTFRLMAMPFVTVQLVLQSSSTIHSFHQFAWLLIQYENSFIKGHKQATGWGRTDVGLQKRNTLRTGLGANLGLETVTIIVLWKFPN